MHCTQFLPEYIFKSRAEIDRMFYSSVLKSTLSVSFLVKPCFIQRWRVLFSSVYFVVLNTGLWSRLLIFAYGVRCEVIHTVYHLYSHMDRYTDQENICIWCEVTHVPVRTGIHLFKIRAYEEVFFKEKFGVWCTFKQGVSITTARLEVVNPSSLWLLIKKKYLPISNTYNK